jgi:hypothetical protein
LIDRDPLSAGYQITEPLIELIALTHDQPSHHLCTDTEIEQPFSFSLARAYA